MNGKKTNILFAALLGLGLSLMVVQVQAAEIVLELDNVPATQCYEGWTEDGVTLSFVETTIEDCSPGACYFGVEPDKVWLFPARLNLDFSALTCTVTGVEVDVIDYCGAGCTKTFLYGGGFTLDDDENTLVSTPETLYLSSGGASVDSMAVSSCEGLVLEIRLTCEESCFISTVR